MNTSAVTEIEPLLLGKVCILFEDGSLLEADAPLGPGYWVRIRQNLLEQGYDPPQGSFASETSKFDGVCGHMTICPNCKHRSRARFKLMPLLEILNKNGILHKYLAHLNIITIH